jgi:hypothetical protein
MGIGLGFYLMKLAMAGYSRCHCRDRRGEGKRFEAEMVWAKNESSFVDRETLLQPHRATG